MDNADRTCPARFEIPPGLLPTLQRAADAYLEWANDSEGRWTNEIRANLPLGGAPLRRLPLRRPQRDPGRHPRRLGAAQGRRVARRDAQLGRADPPRLRAGRPPARSRRHPRRRAGRPPDPRRREPGGRRMTSRGYAAERGLKTLRLFVTGAHSVPEIADRTGVGEATARGVVRQLVSHGLVEEHPDLPRRYRLAAGGFDLGLALIEAAARELELREIDHRIPAGGARALSLPPLARDQPGAVRAEAEDRHVRLRPHRARRPRGRRRRDRGVRRAPGGGRPRLVDAEPRWRGQGLHRPGP